MESVFREAVTLAEKGESFVIATVTGTKGSTPQKSGAKLLIRKDGSAVGTLGGGCVEGDIWFAAKEILRNHEGPEYRDYYLNEDIAARDGLVCGGTMYFLIDPVWKPEEFLSIATGVTEAYDGGETVAMATIVKRGGGSSEVGTKITIRANGITEGTLGSRDLDHVAIKTAERLAPYGKCEQVLTSDGTELFVEAYTSPPSVLLVGGGHISKAVAPIAKTLEFRVLVLDDRSEFSNKERFPEAEQTAIGDYVTGLQQFQITKNTAIIIATRGHNFDDVALEAAARSEAGYVGLVGSSRKVILIYEQLLKRGVPLQRLRDIRSPIGLDIHARTPEEIAVSIMAEVVQFRLGGTGRNMKLPEKQLLRIYNKIQNEAKAEGATSASAPSIETAQPIRG